MTATRNGIIARLKDIIAKRSRAWRAKLFYDVLQPSPSASIIDLGGGRGVHLATFFPTMKNATIADFNPEALAFARETFGFKTQRVDGSDVLPFKDAEFDIVFCSSVIEHVTGEKDDAVIRFKRDGKEFRETAWRHQQQFAREIKRIGRCYFVQTPNRYFPVEVHSWIPLLGFLPTHMQWRVMRLFNHFWPRKQTEPDWSLLGYSDMKKLFPDATIYRERCMGITKSLIAIGGNIPVTSHSEKSGSL